MPVAISPDVLELLRAYALEEEHQETLEDDERRRAWHAGRASAYRHMLEELAGEAPPSAAESLQ